MDIILDLWLSAIYNDPQIQGSDIGPVVYLRNGTGSPLVNYSELAGRWGISKATVGRILKKMAQILSAQGISCIECSKSKYKLLPLSDACRKEYLPRASSISESHFKLAILCGEEKPIATFELTLTPCKKIDPRRTIL